MGSRLVVKLVAGSLGALALLTGSAAARTAGPAFHGRTLTVHLSAKNAAGSGSGGGPIGAIALDGTQAAYVAGVRVTKACGLGERLFRWNLATGRTSPISGAKTCGIPETIGNGLSEVALTASSAAWIVRSGGNTERSETLFSSTAKARADKVLGTSDRFGDPDSGEGFAGTSLGGLVSDGSHISYASWSTAPDQTVTKSELSRIADSRSAAIAEGSGAVVSASADGGHIALLRTDGTIAVYGRDGTLLQTIAGAGRAGAGCGDSCPPGEGVALTDTLVAVLTEAQPNRQAGSIRVYDRTTGALLHTWPAGGYRWQFDASGGIAVYVKATRLHALDLQSGKDVVVARRTRTIQGARFDRAGLLYFVNLRWSAKHGQDGKLVFVPFRTIAGKLGH